MARRGRGDVTLIPRAAVARRSRRIAHLGAALSDNSGPPKASLPTAIRVLAEVRYGLSSSLRRLARALLRIRCASLPNGASIRPRSTRTLPNSGSTRPHLSRAPGNLTVGVCSSRQPGRVDVDDARSRQATDRIAQLGRDCHIEVVIATDHDPTTAELDVQSNARNLHLGTPTWVPERQGYPVERATAETVGDIVVGAMRPCSITTSIPRRTAAPRRRQRRRVVLGSVEEGAVDRWNAAQAGHRPCGEERGNGLPSR